MTYTGKQHNFNETSIYSLVRNMDVLATTQS